MATKKTITIEADLKQAQGEINKLKKELGGVKSLNKAQNKVLAV